MYLAGDRFRPISKKVLDQPQASFQTRSNDNLFTVDGDVEVEIAVDSQPEPSNGPNLRSFMYLFTYFSYVYLTTPELTQEYLAWNIRCVLINEAERT